jgi:hypothetical protein
LPWGISAGVIFVSLGFRPEIFGRRSVMGYAKRKGKHRSFVMLSREMLDHPEWRKLGSAAKLAYIYLKDGYVGSNNGDIRLPYSSLRGIIGLSSHGTISGGLRELETNGWIRRTNLGGLFGRLNAYELTGKYDAYI